MSHRCYTQSCIAMSWLRIMDRFTTVTGEACAFKSGAKTSGACTNATTTPEVMGDGDPRVNPRGSGTW